MLSPHPLTLPGDSVRLFLSQLKCVMMGSVTPSNLRGIQVPFLDLIWREVDGWLL